MKRFFSIFVVTFLFVTINFGQATIEIPLFVTEVDTNYTISLQLGLDLSATNCIDPQLGESECPPIPPTGLFDIRFTLYPYGCGPITVWKDIRNASVFPFTGTIEHTLIWQRSTAGSSINIEYNFPYGTQMRITDEFGGGFFNIGPFTGTGIAVIPGWYNLNEALLIMEYNNIVPVEFTSFTASILQNEKAVQLNWTTATETNNSGFEIERKALSFGEGLGETWEAIGFVPGFGTTTEPKSYSFTDKNVGNGNYKYRLKQIDFDGTFTFSNEIEVNVDFTPQEFVLYQNYPNPFNPSTTIKYEIPAFLNPSKGGTLRNVSLKIYDLLGKEVAVLVNQKQEPGVYEIDFDAGSLSSGVYLYQLIAKGPETRWERGSPSAASSGQSFVQTKKLILLK